MRHRGMFYFPTWVVLELGSCIKCVYSRSLILFGHHLSHTPRWKVLSREAGNSACWQPWEAVRFPDAHLFHHGILYTQKNKTWDACYGHNTPQKTARIFYWSLGQEVSSENSKPNNICTSRLGIILGYVLWKNWQQGGRMKWDSKPSLYLLLYLLVLSPLFAF